MTEPSTCTICQEDISDDARASLEDSCIHVFHSECIKQWALTFLDKKREHRGSPKCPNCKSPFTTIVAFDKSKFVIDIEEEEKDDEWEDFIDDVDDDEEEEVDDDGSDYDDGNVHDDDEIDRCVSCLAQVVELTPNVFRCTASRCTAAIHHHCLGGGDDGDGSHWRCPQCVSRASRALELASRRQAQAANAQRRAQRAQQLLTRRQQRARQQQRLRGQRAAHRASSSSSTSSSSPSPLLPPSVLKLNESLSKAKSATNRSDSATYYITSERALVESFNQARAAAEKTSSRRLAKGGVPARKRKLTGIALEAQQALAGLLPSSATATVTAAAPAILSSSSLLKRRYEKANVSSVRKRDDDDYDEDW